MYVPEIIEVKEHLDRLRVDSLLSDWELPYENLLTRRSAAIFFFTPANGVTAEAVARELDRYDNFSFRDNQEKKLSQLKYRVTFSEEEKEKNEKLKVAQ